MSQGNRLEAQQGASATRREGRQCLSPEYRRLQQVFMNSQGWNISLCFLITSSEPGDERVQLCYRI